MYQIKYFFILLIAGLGIISCKKNFLEVIPTGQLSDVTFWLTKNDADLALAGCYNGWENDVNVLFNDAMSDNGFEEYNWGYRKKGDGQVGPSTVTEAGRPYGIGNDWFTYRRVRVYNNFLAKIDGVSMDTVLKARYKAEVRFLRAYDYFNKVLLFGGVPLVTELVKSDVTLARTPAEEVKKFILDELSAVSKILPVQNNITSGGHITSGAALALKARLELYMGNYADAMTDSKAVIDMGVYALFPDYRGLFLPVNKGNNKESIAQVNYIKDNYFSRIVIFNSPALDGGWSGLNATRSMVEAYETTNGVPITEDPSYDPLHPFKNRDPRLEMTIIYPGQLWNGRYYNSLDKQITNSSGVTIPNSDYFGIASFAGQSVKKYIGPNLPNSALNNYDPNIMVIRLAEMYLTYAEGSVETGQNMDLGLNYINKIRTRAGMVSASVLTRELVRRERRVELAFEGLRLFDVARWNLGPQVLDGPLYGSRLGSVNSQTGEVTWASNYILLEVRNFYPARNYLLPIPQNEMDANPKMTQNPGY